MILKWALSGLALWIALWGVWNHDWRMILAGAATAAIWPLVWADYDRDTEVLDCLWDDEEDGTPRAVTLEAVQKQAGR